MASSAAYQKNYYQQNRDRLREQARLREQRKRALAKAFVSAATQTSAEPASLGSSSEEIKLQTTIQAYAIPPLLAISTFLLIREMVHIYSETWGTFCAVLIAIAIEGFSLLFSFALGGSLTQRVLFRFLALLLSLGSIYGMSANHYSSGLTSYRSDQVTERAISDLETAIKRKQAQSDELQAKGWITAARKLERQIDAMRLELTQLRNTITHSKPSNAVASTTLFEIFVRLALTLCNLVAAHLFSSNLKRMESFKIALGIPRIELGIPGKILKFQTPQKRPPVGFQERILKVFGDELKLWSRGARARS